MEVRSFYGLASFHYWFIKCVSFIIALFLVHEEVKFCVDKVALKAFEFIKNKLCSAPILRPLIFYTIFKVDCDSSGIRISAVLTQAKCTLAYFNKKLNGLILNYSGYDEKFHAIGRALWRWNYYLKPDPFGLHSDHKALSYISAL